MTICKEFLIDENLYSVEIISLGTETVMTVNGRRYKLKVANTGVSTTIETNGNLYVTYAADTNDAVYLKIDSETYHLEKKKTETTLTQDKLSANNINASMPGTVIETITEEGAKIKEGDVILSTESMKMQTNIIAPRDAVIEKIYFKKNETFEKGAILVSLKEV